MKKMWLTVLALMLVVSLVYADQVQVPAPFEKAKEIAMKAGPDSQGQYLLYFEWNEDGTDFSYILGYIPNYNIIGIGDFVAGYVIEFHIDTGEIVVWTPMGTFSVAKEEIPIAIDKAFEIFRVLVAKGWI